MKSWILACLILKRFIPRDLVRLVLIYMYPHKFHTWWLRNERCNMMRDYIKKNNDLFVELVEKTERLREFLHQYQHESGSYYTDTYDCSYYMNGNGVCKCGECGGTMFSIWCEITYRKFSNWYIEEHMDRYDDNGIKLSSLQISNLYYEEFTNYNEQMEKRRIILTKRAIPKIAF